MPAAWWLDQERRILAERGDLAGAAAVALELIDELAHERDEAETELEGRDLEPPSTVGDDTRQAIDEGEIRAEERKKVASELGDATTQAAAALTALRQRIERLV